MLASLLSAIVSCSDGPCAAAISVRPPTAFEHGSCPSYFGHGSPPALSTLRSAAWSLLSGPWRLELSFFAFGGLRACCWQQCHLLVPSSCGSSNASSPPTSFTGADVLLWLAGT